jgi:ubiquinol-cytochrome c reductase cytochrome c subunit
VRVAAGLFLLVGLSLAALGLVMAPGPQTPAVHGQVSSTAVEDGRLLYIQNCASCHGNAGEGSSIAPPLASSGPAALDFYMRTGRMPLAKPGTPSWQQPPQLSADQVAAIVEYASSFSDGPQIPVVASSQDLSRGWELYVNNCAACHGAAADGGSVGAGVTAPALHDRDATTIAEAMLVGPGAMPRFAFPQEDQDAIVAYVHSLDTPPAPGGFPLSGSGPVVEGAIAAILGVAALIFITKWVARRMGPAE